MTHTGALELDRVRNYAHIVGGGYSALEFAQAIKRFVAGMWRLGHNEGDGMKATQILREMGQSMWLDNVGRDFRRSGRLIAIVSLMAACASAQKAESELPVTDPQKIADALRAGPAFITKDATVLDWPAEPGSKYRVLRNGSNEWTCLPGIPGYPHDEPACFDPVCLQWIQDSLAGHTPRIDRVGISYMYVGAWSKSGKGGAEFHVGPHLMIVSPHQDDFQGLNRDASNGMPYVTHLPNRTELFLVMPIRQWDEQHVHE